MSFRVSACRHFDQSFFFSCLSLYSALSDASVTYGKDNPTYAMRKLFWVIPDFKIPVYPFFFSRCEFFNIDVDCKIYQPTKIRAAALENVPRTRALSKDSDQSAHSRSPIRTFLERILDN